jgi:Ser/Thr protein kinase RdoA (MazF antagonist)
VNLEQILLKHWNLEAQNFELVSDRAHSVWHFGAGGATFYARLSKPHIFGERIWGSAARFLRHAFDSGVPVCEILESNSKNLIELLEVKGEIRLVQVLRGVPGQELNLELLEHPEILAAYGESLGKLHAAAKTLETNNLEFFKYSTFWQNVKKNIPANELGMLNEYDMISAWLQTQDETRDFGLNHGDFRPGNAFWDGEQIWLIDFDEPVWHWFPNDVARAMLEFKTSLEDRHQKLETFMAGYRKHHALEFSMQDFAMFSRFRVMLMYLWALEAEAVFDDQYDLYGRILNPYSWSI